MRYIFTEYKYDPYGESGTLEEKIFDTYTDAVKFALSSVGKRTLGLKDRGISYTYTDAKGKADVVLKNGTRYAYTVESLAHYYIVNTAILVGVVLGTLLGGAFSLYAWVSFFSM